MAYSKIRNLIMTVIVCSILVAPCSILVLNKAYPSSGLPQSLEQDKVKYLIGAAQNKPINSTLTLQAFKEGEFQTSVENELKNSFPGRYFALLGYSALQRSFIKASNMLFCFETYPAFYGNDIVFLPEINALAEGPLRINPESKKSLKRISNQLASLAKEYPDKHFCVIVTDISNTAAIQPVMSYTNHHISSSGAANKLNSNCRNINNITVFADTNSNIKNYYDNYYTTDHHWNGWGALKAYKKAVQLIGEEQHIEVDTLTIPRSFEREEELDNLIINGSYSRSSLTLLNESANEPSLSLENTTVRSIEFFPETRQTPPQIMLQSSSKSSNDDLPLEFNFYETWYGGSINMILTNSQHSSANILVIGDSYSTSFSWIASQACGSVTLYQDMRGNAEPREPVRKRINTTDPDFVFVVACTQNFIKTFEKKPDYFK